MNDLLRKIRPATRLVLIGALSAWALTGCGRSDRPSGTDAGAASGPNAVVATVGESTIAVATLEQELARRGLPHPSAQDKAATLEDLVRVEALYAQAKKTGFDQNAEVRTAIKHLIVGRYRQELEAKQSAAKPATPDEIKAYYETHRDRYQVSEQLNAAVIFLPLSPKATPEKRTELARKAADLRAQALAAANQRANFGLLAQTNSAHQASRYRGGELGWLTRQSAALVWEPALVEAMFALQQPGELSPVVTGRDGFYLFKLVGRKAASVRALADVREPIAYQLSREKAAQREIAMFDQVKSGLPIRINEPLLQRIVPAPAKNQPPAAMPGR